MRPGQNRPGTQWTWYTEGTGPFKQQLHFIFIYIAQCSEIATAREGVYIAGLFFSVLQQMRRGAGGTSGCHCMTARTGYGTLNNATHVVTTSALHQSPAST